MDCNKILQSVTEFSFLIHQMLRNTEAETNPSEIQFLDIALLYHGVYFLNEMINFIVYTVGICFD